MHPDFPTWYRALSLSPSPELLRLRWLVIENLTAQPPTNQLALDLVRLARGAPPVAVEGTKTLREAAIAADPQFPDEGNDFELQVLAAGALEHLFRKRGQATTVAALALACSRFTTKSRHEFIPDMTHTAEEYLVTQGQQIRITGARPAPTTSERLYTAVKALQNTSNTITQQDATEDALSTLTKQANQVNARAKECITALDAEREQIKQRELVWQEQAKILWWYVSRQSTEMGELINEESASQTCLVLGEDLADRICLLPGPVYAKAVLAGLLAPMKSGSSITVIEAVEALPAEWRTEWLARYGEILARDLCPIASVLWGASRPLWDGYATLCTTMELSYQFYLENLLFQCLQDSERFYY